MATRLPFGSDEITGQVDGLRLALRTYPAGQCHALHTHADLTFFLVLGGGMVEHCGSRRTEFGYLTFGAQTNEVEHSSLISESGMRALFLQVTGPWLARHQSCAPSYSAYEMVDDARVLGAIGLAVELASKAPEPMVMEERILELCARAPQGDASVRRERPGWLNAVQDLIHDEYDQPLSLAQLADSAGVHPVHLARVFRAMNNRSVSGYLRAVRVKEAIRKSKRMPLGTAAVECGFADQSHFCRSVRRELKRTPGQVLSVLQRDPMFQSFY